jgi:catalase
MTPVKTTEPIVPRVLEAFDAINGSHPGFRPAHAKGILLAGKFIPSPAGASLTRAPHLHRTSTPVTVRFSDSTGLPLIPDNDPNASPRGIAIRFHLAEHVHTDIIGHSVDGFPVRTADEFVELLTAARASGPDSGHPSPIEKFLGAHPAALAFVQAPKPIPASFFEESFYGVSAHRFINAQGISRFGRYRIQPESQGRHLDATETAQQSPNFLFDEVPERLAKGPVRMRIAVQIAAEGDAVDDATAHWPKDRELVELGAIEVTSVLPNGDAEQQHIIFDPIARVEGIDPSNDPLLEPRAAIYLASGRRRRKENRE